MTYMRGAIIVLEIAAAPKKNGVRLTPASCLHRGTEKPHTENTKQGAAPQMGHVSRVSLSVSKILGFR